MFWSQPRHERRHEADRPADNRNWSQRDRDRILYTTALRRLDRTTQVASANEPSIFHNRLTHTLEVAQVARRLAEHVIEVQPDDARELEVDPEIAEAGALAHDLGHPPFGHVGEETLSACVAKRGNEDGFEGNAQSFRIVTKLAVRVDGQEGLNLSRASLNAILKYPFQKTAGRRKFGAYRTEDDDFSWARSGLPVNTRSPEAEIMDWADDIAYSVHDIYDFFRARMIPLERIAADRGEFDRFLDAVEADWEANDRHPGFSRDELVSVWRVLQTFPFDQPFNGSRGDRAALRTFTSFLISRYVREPFRLKLPSDDGSCVEIERGARVEVDVLKQLTWRHVVKDPALAAIQHGQRRVLEELFDTLMADAGSLRPKLLSRAAAESVAAAIEGIHEPANRRSALARVVADLLAGMTEDQALALHKRVTGHVSGSILDPLW